MGTKRFPEVQHLVNDKMSPLFLAAVRSVAWLDTLTGINIQPEVLTRVEADKNALVDQILSYEKENTYPVSESLSCPKCGCAEVSTLQRVLGIAQGTMEIDPSSDDNVLQHSGSAEMDYNNVNPVVDLYDRPVLMCASCEYEWVSTTPFEEL